MKWIKYLGIALIFASLYSCDNVTEEIYLNADGSGEYKVYADVIPGLTLAYLGFMSMDSTAAEKTEAAVTEIILDKIWEDFPEGVVDSISAPTEADLAKITDTEKREMVQGMQTFVQGSRVKNYLNYGMEFKFKNVAQLNKYLKVAEEQANTDDSSFALGGTNKNVKVDMDFKSKKRCFKRNNTYTQIREHDLEELDRMKQLFGHGKARTIIHLPKNVKSVKGNGLVEQTDRKVVFEYNIIEMGAGEVDTDFEIKWN